MIIKKSTPTAEIELTDDGIISYRSLPNMMIGSEEAKANINLLKGLANGRRMPIFVDMRNVAGLDYEARKLSQEFGKQYTLCSAILVDNGISKIIGNFFLGFAKPGDAPVKIFQDENTAMEWLKTTAASLQNQHDK